MSFNFCCYIFRNDFFKMNILLINLFCTVVDKGNKIRSIPDSYDYTRSILCMLQTRSNAKSKLFHDHYFFTNTYGLNSMKSATLTVTDFTFPPCVSNGNMALLNSGSEKVA